MTAADRRPPAAPAPQPAPPRPPPADRCARLGERDGPVYYRVLGEAVARASEIAARKAALENAFEEAARIRWTRIQSGVTVTSQVRYGTGGARDDHVYISTTETRADTRAVFEGSSPSDAEVWRERDGVFRAWATIRVPEAQLFPGAVAERLLALAEPARRRAALLGLAREAEDRGDLHTAILALKALGASAAAAPEDLLALSSLEARALGTEAALKALDDRLERVPAPDPSLLERRATLVLEFEAAHEREGRPGTALSILATWIERRKPPDARLIEARNRLVLDVAAALAREKGREAARSFLDSWAARVVPPPPPWTSALELYEVDPPAEIDRLRRALAAARSGGFALAAPPRAAGPRDPVRIVGEVPPALPLLFVWLDGASVGTFAAIESPASARIDREVSYGEDATGFVDGKVVLAVIAAEEALAVGPAGEPAIDLARAEREPSEAQRLRRYVDAVTGLLKRPGARARLLEWTQTLRRKQP